MTPTEKPFENIVGKGENGGNEHFLTMFSSPSKIIFKISVTFILLFANAFNLDQSKNFVIW